MIDDGAPASQQSERLAPRRSVARNAVVLLTSQSITWVLATFVVWVIPQFVSPEGIGHIGIPSAYWAIATVACAFGTGTMLTVEIARDPATARSLTRRVQTVRFGAWLVAFPAVLAVIWAGPYGRTVFLAAVLGGGAALANLLGNSYSATLYGLQEMGYTAAADVVTKLLRAVLTVGVLVLGGGVLAVVTAWFAVSVVGAVVLHVGLNRATAESSRPADLKGRSLIRASAPYFASATALIVYQQVDTVMMSLLVGAEPIGQYASADLLFGSLLFVPVIVMTAMFPAIAELHERAPDEVIVLLRRSVGPMLLLAVPIGAGTVVVSSSFVKLLFGAEFAPAGDVLAVFGVVLIPTCLTILLGQFAIATGRAAFWTKAMVAAIAISIVLDIILVPIADRHFGNAALAGAIAFVVTEVFLVVVGLSYLAPTLVGRALAWRAGRLLLAGAAMVAAGWPVRQRFFVIPGTVGVLAFVLAVIILRALGDDEREFIRRGTTTIRRKLRPRAAG